MHKNWIKLALTSSMVLMQVHPLLAAAPRSRPTSAPPAASAEATTPVLTKAVFRAMMNDPELNRLHLRAQLRRLKTAIDFGMQNYFDTNPLIQEILPSFLSELETSVQATTTKNQLTMQEITSKSSPVLHYKLVQMMRMQGYSDTQIDNTVFYRALGDINAYAYTFSPDKVGFVLLTGLDDISTRRELMGVFGHESGHIRSGHVKYGSLDSMLQMRVMNALFQKSPASASSSEERAKFDELKKSMVQNQLSLFLKPAVGSNPMDPRQRSVDQNSELRTKLGKVLDEYGRPVDEQTAEMQASALMDYLDRVIDNLSRLEIPPRYIAILENAKQRLLPGDPIAVNMEQLAEAFKVWSLAYSRECETSADYFGAIIGRPSQVAMVDAKLSGRDIGVKQSNADIQNIIKAVKLQVEKAQRMNTREDYYEIMGGPESSDHPFSNLRVLREAKFDQSIDRIALENPFLQIVVDLDEAREEINEINSEIKESRKLKAAFKQKGLTRLEKQVQAQIKKLQGQKDEALRSIAKIEPQIILLLEDPAFNKRHPRATDLLDYRLAQKQMLEADLALLQSMASTMKPVTYKSAVALLKKSLAEITGDKILQPALASLQKSSDAAELKIADLAQKALAETSTQEDTLAARTTLSELSKSRARISLQVAYEEKSSSTLLDAKGTFKGEAAEQPIAALTQSSKAKTTALTCRDLLKR